MKLFARLGALSVLVSLIVVLALAGLFSASAADQPDYPSSINGLPVIDVDTHEDTPSLPDGRVNIVLLDSASSTPEEAIAAFDSGYLSMNGLPAGWSIDICGGTGTSEDSYQRLNEKEEERYRNDAPVAYGLTTDGRGRSIVRDNDAGPSGFNSLRAQWTSPTIGTNQSYYSLLLVNGMTNYDYFFQSGQWYASSGQGHNAWTDDSVYLQMQDFTNVPYVSGHVCWFQLGRAQTCWWMSAHDQTAGVWQLHANYLPLSTTGDHLDQTWDTSVWFENVNVNATWYYGFTQDIAVYDAWDGSSYPAAMNRWSSCTKAAFDRYGNQYTNHASVTGTLKSGGTATFHLNLVPIGSGP